MIFKPYPKYTSCAIQWFNEIPQSWKQVRVEQYLIKKYENIGDLWSSTQLLSLTQKGIIEKDINEGKGKTHSDYSTYQAIDIGDLVFCLFDIDETPRTVGLSTKKGMITSAYTAFKSKENINTQYVYYFFESLDDAKALKPYYKGLRKTVRPPEFLKIHVPFPPKVEQVAISQFLDTETARIDNLIAKQEKLIELLEEQRKSIISHAVTKGLNPNAPMKDSGVEWLGDVPESWEVIPSKFYFTERKEKAVNGDKQLTASQKHGIIYQDEFIAENGRVMVVMKNPEILKKVRPNDFVISMRSFQGGLELSSLEGSISSAYVMLKPDLSLINTEYFKYLFKTPRYIQSLQSTSNLIRDGQALRFNNFSQVKLVLPPKSEQQEIVEYLDKEKNKIDNLIYKQKTLIEKLKEYRASIISHAVTGKIDVREFGA